jgi:hypothetical protein
MVEMLLIVGMTPFKGEMEKPDGERFEPFHIPAAIVTGAMLVGPALPEVIGVIRAIPVDKAKAVANIVMELKKQISGHPVPSIPQITVITAQRGVKKITDTSKLAKSPKPAEPPPPPQAPPPAPPPPATPGV